MFKISFSQRDFQHRIIFRVAQLTSSSALNIQYVRTIYGAKFLLDGRRVMAMCLGFCFVKYRPVAFLFSPWIYITQSFSDVNGPKRGWYDIASNEVDYEDEFNFVISRGESIIGRGSRQFPSDFFPTCAGAVAIEYEDARNFNVILLAIHMLSVNFDK